MKSRHNILINLAILLGIIIVVNVLSGYVYKTIDLTEDKRFTLTAPTNKLLGDLKGPIYVQVLLEGKLPLEFQRLQTATIEMLSQYKKRSGGHLEYEMVDPSAGTVEQINKMRSDMAEEGIYPVNIRVMEGDNKIEKLVYPYVMFRVGTRVHAVNVLETEAIAVSPDVQLNNSISLLEYKYSNAIEKLLNYEKKNIAFLAGHGELEKYQTYDLENTLRKFYNTGRLYLDSVYKIDQQLDLVIVPKPRFQFSERDKFILDQYVMKGGKLLWMIDRLNIDLDSIRTNERYVPFEYNLNLDDFFFKHGIRINSDLIQDLESTRIPLGVNETGGRKQYELFKWPYHILAVPKVGHPVTNNLDRVNLAFPSTIDTLKSKYNLNKEVLLTSSAYSRFQLTPIQLDVNIVRVPPIPEKYNKPHLPVAVLLEGEFASLFENRVTEAMQAGLTELGEVFTDKSESNKMLVVSDGDLPLNKMKGSAKEYWPMGYNIYERRAFANKEFVLNAIEYLIGDGGVLASRTKEVKLRLLNTIKASQEKTKWQLINVVSPLVLLLLFGIIYHLVRRRRYGIKHKQ